MTSTTDDDALTRFLFEMAHLKRTTREGWVYAGVPNPESVAEHSFGAAVLAYVLATMEGASAERAAAMALFHDTQETRIGDIPYVGKQYLKAADNVTVTQHQTAPLPDAVGEPIREIVGEYEAGQTAEARLASDADKLECVVQARVYQSNRQGDTQEWIDSCVAQLRSDSAIRLAAALSRMDAHEWWRAVTGQTR